jgi:hypothetical protein
MMADRQAMLRTRYGSNRGRQKYLIIAIVSVGVLFVGWVIWAGVQQADQAVRWSTVGYSNSSATSVTVEFDVFKPSGSTVICLVRALDLQGSEVGRAEVPVTSAGSDTNVVYALPVTARPNTAEVVRCRLDP